jgi:hypothetical protein
VVTEKRPTAQITQLVDADAPVVARYAPAGQLVHVEEAEAPGAAE